MAAPPSGPDDGAEPKKIITVIIKGLLERGFKSVDLAVVLGAVWGGPLLRVCNKSDRDYNEMYLWLTMRQRYKATSRDAETGNRTGGETSLNERSSEICEVNAKLPMLTFLHVISLRDSIISDHRATAAELLLVLIYKTVMPAIHVKGRNAPASTPSNDSSCIFQPKIHNTAFFNALSCPSNLTLTSRGRHLVCFSCCRHFDITILERAERALGNECLSLSQKIFMRAATTVTSAHNAARCLSLGDLILIFVILSTTNHRDSPSNQRVTHTIIVTTRRRLMLTPENWKRSANLTKLVEYEAVIETCVRSVQTDPV
ncbi:hypothetical protein J6590_000111 [Homalodisca vitripennis]|nr:hypothetical protein J6590_000111 [Homalodisca vitripennis]